MEDSTGSVYTLTCPGPRECLRLDLGVAPAAQLQPWGNVALHSCLHGSASHMSFCFSNNRISVAGALSLGLGLR